MYELRMVEKIDGQVPSKLEFMENMGNVFGMNLTDYHKNLSQSLQNQPLEANIKVFKEMIAITEDTILQKNNIGSI